MHPDDLAMEFYADYDYNDPYWDAELERQSRQIQHEADIRSGWREQHV